MSGNDIDCLSSELPRMPMFLTDFAVHSLGEIVLDYKYTLGRLRKSASQQESMFCIAPLGYTATRSGPSAIPSSQGIDGERLPVTDIGNTKSGKKKGPTVGDDGYSLPIMLRVFRGPYFVVIPSDATISSNASTDPSAVVAAVTSEVINNNGPLPNGVVVGRTPLECWRRFIKERRPASAAAITSAVANAMFGLSDIHVQKAIHLLPNAKDLDNLAAECESKALSKGENTKQLMPYAKCVEKRNRKEINGLIEHEGSTTADTTEGCIPTTVKPVRKMRNANPIGAATITTTACPLCNCISPFCAVNGKPHSPAHTSTILPIKKRERKQKITVESNHNLISPKIDVLKMEDAVKASCKKKSISTVSAETRVPITSEEVPVTALLTSSDKLQQKDGVAPNKSKRTRNLSKTLVLESAALQPGVQTKRRRKENTSIAVSNANVIPGESVDTTLFAAESAAKSVAKMPSTKKRNKQLNQEQTTLVLMDGDVTTGVYGNVSDGFISLSQGDCAKQEQLSNSNPKISSKKKLRTPKIDTNGNLIPLKTRVRKKVEDAKEVIVSDDNVGVSKKSGTEIKTGKSNSMSNISGKTQMPLTFGKISKDTVASSGVKSIVSKSKLRSFFNKRSNNLAKQIYNDENGVHSDTSLEALGLTGKGPIRAFKAFAFQYLSERSKTNLVKKVMSANGGKLPEKYKKFGGVDPSALNKSRGGVDVNVSSNMPSSIVMTAAADRAPNARKNQSTVSMKQGKRQGAKGIISDAAAFGPITDISTEGSIVTPLKLQEVPVQSFDNIAKQIDLCDIKGRDISPTSVRGEKRFSEMSAQNRERKDMNYDTFREGVVSTTESASSLLPISKEGPSTKRRPRSGLQVTLHDNKDDVTPINTCGLSPFIEPYTNGDINSIIAGTLTSITSNHQTAYQEAGKETTV